jgi:hypothetical protein
MCISLIGQPLSHIYNQSLYTGILPDRLKLSMVKLLFKKGDKTSTTNCRAISLLTVFLKVLEKVVYNRLSQCTRTNNILVPEQFGFTQGSSTENAALKLTDSVFKSVNQKNACWWNTL